MRIPLNDKKLATEQFDRHRETAKAAAVLCNGCDDNAVDNMLDDLALCLDRIYSTSEFSLKAVQGI